MGFREEYGGKLEEALNKAVDKHLDMGMIRKQILEKVDELLEKHLDDKVKQMLKADVIDLIDGEDDIK